MARERGVADHECGVSMRSWGWLAEKKTDAVVCPRCGEIVIPAGPSGTFDFPEVQVPQDGQVALIAVEAKADDTSFNFAKLREDQRAWIEGRDRPGYIWLCLGRGAVNAQREPRITYFFPYEVFLELERAFERKSIPYECSELAAYRLTWAGHHTWQMPQAHPFKTTKLETRTVKDGTCACERED